MNSQQKEAIEKTKGPCVILAGAGTGKTYTIIEKLKYLISTKSYPPEKIVCLTFSNEAANEMRKRILPHLNQNDQEPIIKTFHAFCSDILRKHGSKINIPKDFNILLPDDAKILLHKNFKLNPSLCHKYVSEIGTAKDLCITQDQIQSYLEKKLNNQSIIQLEKELENTQFLLQTLHINKDQIDKDNLYALKNQIEDLNEVIKLHKLLQTWNAYEKLKNLKKSQDYSDLNQNALKLLIKFPDIAHEYQYIIVDEFQDTNKLQCNFLDKIAPHKNITIVGDLNQSIYRFRGAYKNNLEHFKNNFNIQKSDIYALDKSFRSTNNILRTAHKLIQQNYTIKEECFPVYSAENLEGEKTQIYELKNNKEETRKTIELIKSQLNKGIPHEEICVMFRTHQQARSLKSSLEYEKIPYTSVTKKSLLKLTPIKLTIDYLTILYKINSKSIGAEQEWWDLIYNSNFPKEDSIKISKFIKINRKENLSIKFINNHSILNLSEKGKIQLFILIKRIKSLIPYSNLPITDFILKIYEIAGIRESSSDILRKEKTLVLKKFHEIAEEYKTSESKYLASFLHHLEIISSLGIEIEAPSLDNQGIRIMTNHATKGLEYHTVIVSSLAKNRFPMENISKSLIPRELNPEISSKIHSLPEFGKKYAIQSFLLENQILEERRLCYVAFTRTKRQLFLTYANQYGNRKTLPSQFLNEIQYKQNQDLQFFKDTEEKFINPQLELKFKPASEISNVFKNPDKIIPQNDKKIIPDNLTFSPSSLSLFDQCQKKYEYRYVYNMPEPRPLTWDVLKLGSFIHLISEIGVKQNLKEEKKFLDLTKLIHQKDDWNSLELCEAIKLIKVFFQRNKNKFSEKSLTEQKLSTTINNIKFLGYADRIDIHDKNIEIIDYKTGASKIHPKYRNWQLGFYALAAKQMNLGNPKHLTLDMLKHEHPIEFELDEYGNANEIHSQRTSFNLDEVKSQLIETANKIIQAYKTQFHACPPEKNCTFCNEYVWEIS